MEMDPARILICPINITEEAQVIATVDKVKEKYGRIDALINVAAIIGDYGLAADCSLENFKNIYSVNVFGTFAMMKYVLPIMVAQEKGNIVNFGSVSGMTGYTCEIGYGSSKWAVIGMTKNVANEYGQYGIRCNSISPGWVNTAMFQKSVEDFADLEDASITLGPLGRPSEPAEMADIVYFMCQPEANFLNGSNVLADGGMMLG
jgi:NAD(P)-dependent dehydrogenase (short-subunit alcohol dehydrogenase family)